MCTKKNALRRGCGEIGVLSCAIPSLFPPFPLVIFAHLGCEGVLTGCA